MKEAKEKFEDLFDRYVAAYPEVEFGKMMSAPALRKNGKVFAFFHEDCMTFKLGKGRDLAGDFGVEHFRFLSPFKNKPPMTAWYQVGVDYADRWHLLLEEALQNN